MRGQVIGPLTLGPVAHGGHVVARHEGRVVFVRHGLPGEEVMVVLTDTRKASMWHGDVVEVLNPSPDRTEPPCPVAGVCGGCDLQHVSAEGQLRWKTAVLSEQLQRLAQITWEGEVERPDAPLPGSELLGWRTRMTYRIDRDDHGRVDRVGLLAHRSHEVIEPPKSGCPIADPAGPSMAHLRRWAEDARGDDLRVAVGDGSDGRLVSVASSGQVIDGPTLVDQRVGDRTHRVHPAGFWQVHPSAAQVLTDLVLEGLDPQPGETALDLYCGVGLFAGALADRGVSVTGVEINRHAVAQARLNVPQARFIAASLDRALGRLPRRVDLVVLDPARAGAGDEVVRHVSRLGARAIVHIGCDPAAFARDLKLFADQGWRPAWIRGFDLFPMTQHLEAVALLLPID